MLYLYWPTTARIEMVSVPSYSIFAVDTFVGLVPFFQLYNPRAPHILCPG